MVESSETTLQLLTIQELSVTSRLSVTTLHRLKRQGKIPYFQPAGKNGRLLFPADAIERSITVSASGRGDLSPSSTAKKDRLAGPSPAWMRAVH